MSQSKMNSKPIDSLKQRINKASHPMIKKEGINKENVELQNIDSSINNSKPIFLGKIKIRKNSDSSYDRPFRAKGLHEVDPVSNQNGMQIKRNYSSSDTPAPKTFGKARFAVYDEDVFEQDGLITEKSTNESKPKPQLAKSNKSTQLRERVTSNIVQQVSKQKVQIIKQVKQSVLDKKKPAHSPENLRPSTKKDVPNIKELHRRANITKRTPRDVYDILSLELAYNMDYMNEYVRFQLEINDKKKLSSEFLTNGISEDQRRLIIKYLIKVTAHCKYPSFIVYQAVKIFDSYIDTVNVKVTELQMSALGALWIALKKDLLSEDIPDASTVVEFAGPAYQGNNKPLFDSEKKILMSLNFEVSFADPFSMLALYTVTIPEVRILESKKIQEMYYYGSYLMDLSLLSAETVRLSAVHLAAVSFEIALVLTMNVDEDLKSGPQWTYWRNRVFKANPITEKFRMVSNDFDKYGLSDAEMNNTRIKLLGKVKMSSSKNSDFHVVFQKYSKKRFGMISNFMTHKVSLIPR